MLSESVPQDKFPSKYNLENIQKAFSEHLVQPIWVCSKDKKPYNPRTGTLAKSNDPSTWGTFSQMYECLEKTTGYMPAIALDHTKNMIAIDLDKCRDANGKITPEAQKILDKVQSYTEVSTGGNGIHIFSYGKKPGTACKKSLGEEGKSVEIYESNKFITLTGNILPGQPVEVREAQEALTEIYTTYFPDKDTSTTTSFRSPSMSDEEVLTKCRNAKNKDKFIALYDRGDTSSHASNDSDADLALIGLMGFYTQDHQQLDRLFRGSKLMRDKWDNREDYRNETIKKAVNNLRAVYKRQPVCTVEELDPIQAAKYAQDILKEDEDPCKSYDIKHLPPLLQEYMKAKMEQTDAPPIMLIMSVLAMTSGFIKKRCYIPKGRYFQDLYPNIWELAILESGGFKTTALKDGMECAQKREKELYEHYKVVQALVKKGDVPPEVQQAREKIIKESILLPQRTTAEALIENLSLGHGGVICSSEFGAWLASLEANYNTDLKALFTDFFDVPESYVYVTRTGGRQAVTKPFISICGMAALPWITKNVSLKDVESGFFARFLLFMPKIEKRIPPALPQHRGAVAIAIENTIYEKLSSVSFPHEGRLRLSTEAEELFEVLHKNMYVLIAGLGPETAELLNPFLKRWSPYLLKLAMNLRVYDEDEKHDLITAEHLIGAMSILDPAIKSTIKLFQQQFGESPIQAKLRKVLAYIARKEGVIEHGKLLQSRVLEGGKSEYEYVIGTLIDSGQIVVEEQKQKKRWRYALAHNQTPDKEVE